MAEDSVIFEPRTPFTPGDARTDLGIKAGIALFTAAVVLFSYSRGTHSDSSFFFTVVIVLCCFIYILMSTRKRYAVRLIINQRLRLMKIEYLNPFGEEGVTYMDIRKLINTLSRGVRSARCNLVLYDNYFTNYISITEDEYFPIEELREIHNLLKNLQSS